MRKNALKWPVYHPYQLNRFSDDLETYARTLLFQRCIYVSDFAKIGLRESGQNESTDIYKRLTSLCQQTQVSLVSSLCLYKTQPSRMTLAREKSNRIYWSHFEVCTNGDCFCATAIICCDHFHCDQTAKVYCDHFDHRVLAVRELRARCGHLGQFFLLGLVDHFIMKTTIIAIRFIKQ